jgi:hypothetical protein
MSKEIMLECFWDAIWVYEQAERTITTKGRRWSDRTALAAMAAALYQERMFQANNNTNLLMEDASWLRGL